MSEDLPELNVSDCRGPSHTVDPPEGAPADGSTGTSSVGSSPRWSSLASCSSAGADGPAPRSQGACTLGHLQGHAVQVHDETGVLVKKLWIVRPFVSPNSVEAITWIIRKLVRRAGLSELLRNGAGGRGRSTSVGREPTRT